jgi:hypothetical protein
LNQFTPCKGKPDSTTQVGLQDTMSGNSLRQQSKSQSGSHLSLVHVIHVIPLRAIRVWPIHYPSIHHCRRGEVSSNSVTGEVTKFVGPHKSLMHQYIINLAHRGQTIGPQLTQAGLPPQSSEYENSSLSSFPSHILHNP